MAAARPGVYVSPVIPDPGVRHGRFRVLRRVDGLLIVVDEARPIADRVVWKSKTTDELPAATQHCRELSEAASARGEKNEGP